MSIDEQELRAIQFLAERVRKTTSGCAAWDSHGLTANLRKLANRNLHMTIEHVLRHAADPTAKNPGVLLGAYTPEAPKAAGHFTPPKKGEHCPTHPAYFADNCGGCNVEQFVAYYDVESVPPMTTGTKAGADACRAAMKGDYA